MYLVREEEEHRSNYHPSDNGKQKIFFKDSKLVYGGFF